MNATASTSTCADLDEVALTAARAGAAAIRAVLMAGTLATDSKSGSHDLVTTADKASEAAIVAAISGARPDDSILGEEGGLLLGSSPVRWVVDPIDGTANFVYGRGDWAISVGAEVNGIPTAGAVLRPSDGSWVLGGPAGVVAGFDPGVAGKPVPGIRQGDGLEDAIVAFGLPHSLTERRQALAAITRLVPQLRGLRIIGTAAGELASLALGECDAWVGFGLAEWDTSAGHAIVLAGGGTVTSVDTPTGQVLIAGSAARVASLSTLIQNTEQSSQE